MRRPFDDLVERLEQWGASAPPPPDPTFLQALQRRLAAGSAPVAELTPLPTRARPSRRLWVAAAATVAAATAAVAVVADRPDSTDAELVAAADATVLGPDGSPLDVAPGAPLPDGATITVGAEGSAEVVIAGERLRLGPGQQLAIDRPSSGSGPTGGSPPASVVDGAVPLRVTAVRVADAVELDWTAVEVPTFHRWVVLRAEGIDPVWPFDLTTVRLVDSDHPGRNHWRDAGVPTGPDLRYRVIAIDAAGAVLADSGPVHPVVDDRGAVSTPGTSDPTTPPTVPADEPTDDGTAPVTDDDPYVDDEDRDASGTGNDDGGDPYFEDAEAAASSPASGDLGDRRDHTDRPASHRASGRADAASPDTTGSDTGGHGDQGERRGSEHPEGSAGRS